MVANIDKRIDLDELIITESKMPLQLPTNIKCIDEVRPEDVKVYIRQDVLQEINAYSTSDTTKELGGMLIGDYVEVMDKLHVVISGYIQAEYTDASAASLTFTHETWEHVHRQHAEHYPDSKIIGWHHTHPGYSVFLSNYDLFIQQNFFNLKWQVAMVIDPKKDDTGFYQWKGDRIERTGGYFIYDEEGKAITVKSAKTSSQRAMGTVKKVRSMDIVLVVLILLLAVFSITTAINNKTTPNIAGPTATPDDRMDLLDDQVNDLTAKYTDLNQRYGILQANNDDLIKRLEALNHTAIPAPTAAPTSVPAATVVPSATADSLQFIQYTIVKGDTLSKICARHNIDYMKYRDMILGMNSIANENKIYVGMILVLPIT